MNEEWDINTPRGMRLAKAWTQMHLHRLKEGGVWYVPRVASTYTVYHSTRTIVRTGLMPDTAITKVLKALGWKLIEGNKP